MTASNTTSATAAARVKIEPRWGLGDAAVGWLLAESMAQVSGLVLLGATGRLNPMGQEVLNLVGRATGHTATATFTPLWMTAVLELFLWVGFFGVPLVATRMKGNGLVADLGLRFRPVDVPIGIAAGLLSQFVLAYALSWPWVHLLGRKMSDLSGPADQLTSRATNPVGVILLTLIVVIGAPVVEEIFFRGLLQRSLLKNYGAVVAVAGSAAFFGLTHFELLQLPALVGFGVVLGVLAVRTGRLGPGIFAHLSFNAVTVVSLLANAHK